MSKCFIAYLVFGPVKFDEEPSDYIRHVEEASLGQSGNIVNDLVDLWKGNEYDVASRVVPDNPAMIAICAGDMSSGDEPDDAGYQVLKQAEFLGLFEILGIK